MSEQFARWDTRRVDGVYITFHLETSEDAYADAPDQSDCGFWPSRDPKAAGYVLPENFDEEQRKAEERMKAWKNGWWCFIGVRVRAEIDIIRNGSGITHSITSAGLWGVESDCGEAYLAEIYMDEVSELIADLDAIGGQYGLQRTYRGAR